MFDVGFKPHQIQDVMEAKVKTWNEALTLLGIMNVNSGEAGAYGRRGGQRVPPARCWRCAPSP